MLAYYLYSSTPKVILRHKTSNDKTDVGGIKVVISEVRSVGQVRSGHQTGWKMINRYVRTYSRALALNSHALLIAPLGVTTFGLEIVYI